jgi:hypothetical protein
MIATVCVLWACAGTSGPERTAPSEYRIPGERISVLEFSLDGAAVSYAKPYDTFGLVIAEQIAAELRDLGYRADAVPTGGNPTGDFRVSGRITRIDAGSRAARYWAGYGAGAAKFGLEGSVAAVDQDTQVTFSDERWAGTGVFGGESVSLVQRCVRQVARDVAEMIHTGQYTSVR